MRPIIDTLKKLAGPVQPVPRTGANITVRYARPQDADALAVLAELDTSPAPRGEIIVAEAEGELWAAVSVDDGNVIATPFRPTGELTYQLLERARRVNPASTPGRRRRGPARTPDR